MLLSKYKYKYCSYFLLSNIIILLLTSCGYNLRGWHNSPLNIQSINIDYNKISLDSVNYQFIHDLTNSLKAHNIKVITSDAATNNFKDNKNYIFKILINTANYTKNITSTSSSQLVAQYKLKYSVNYSLYKNTDALITDQDIITERNVNYNQEQVLGLSNEEQTVTSELIRETIDRIINQLYLTTK